MEVFAYVDETCTRSEDSLIGAITAHSTEAMVRWDHDVPEAFQRAPHDLICTYSEVTYDKCTLVVFGPGRHEWDAWGWNPVLGMWVECGYRFTAA